MNISNIVKIVEEITENNNVIADVSAISPKAGLVMKAIPLILALLKEGHIDGKEAALSVHSLIDGTASPKPVASDKAQKEQEALAKSF